MLVANKLIPIVAGACVLSLAAPLSAEEFDGLTLSPTSDWRMREFDDRCRVSRTFGEGENRTTMWIEQGGEEPNYNLTLIGRPLRHPYGGGVHVQFGNEPEFIRSYLTAESSRGRPVLMMYGLSINQPDLEREEVEAPARDVSLSQIDAITDLKLRTSIVEPIQFELGSMTEPLGFLGLCGAKLAGVLSAAGRTLTGEASPPQAIDSDRWLNLSDYPNHLIAARMQGTIRVRLTVNTSGRASSCFVVGSNKPQLFDDAVCLGLMRRAEFKPARNAQGEAVPSYYFYSVSFAVR